MKTLVHVLTVSDSVLFLRGQPPFMREHGIETVVVASPGERLDAFRSAYKVPTREVEMLRKIAPVRDLLSLVQLVSVLSELKADIVHAQTPKGGLLGIVSGALLRVPKRVYHLRGLPLETATGWRKTLLWVTERTACTLATDVVAVSESLRSRAVELRIAPRSKVQVIGKGSGQGVDSTRFAPSTTLRRESRERYGYNAEVVFLFVGRLVADKGIRELTEAWTSVRTSIPNARLLIVGPREPRDPVPSDVLDRLQNDDRVVFTGFLSDVRSAYAASDVLVLPSRREGFPNVPLEAASMELPVITTDATGCIDSVEHGSTGTVVPVGDAAALAAAMRRYAHDAELRMAHGRQGRVRVLTDFLPERLWRGILDVYETS